MVPPLPATDGTAEDEQVYSDYVRAWFGSDAAVALWSERGLYDPKSNEGGRYNDKFYRMKYALEAVPETQKESARAVDLGCGAGVYLPFLREKGYAVTALDISGEMIASSRDLCRRLGVDADLLVADCNATGLPDRYADLCLCVGLIEHQKSDEPLLTEVRRILKPGGLLVVTFRNSISVHARLRSIYVRRVEVALRNLKRALLGRPRVATVGGWDSRQHRPWRLARTLRGLGFDVCGRRYSHFYFLPEPFASAWPGVEARLAKPMEHLSGTPLGWIGSTGIFTARLTRP